MSVEVRNTVPSYLRNEQQRTSQLPKEQLEGLLQKATRFERLSTGVSRVVALGFVSEIVLAQPQDRIPVALAAAIALIGVGHLMARNNARVSMIGNELDQRVFMASVLF